MSPEQVALKTRQFASQFPPECRPQLDGLQLSLAQGVEHQ